MNTFNSLEELVYYVGNFEQAKFVNLPLAKPYQTIRDVVNKRFFGKPDIWQHQLSLYLLGNFSITLHRLEKTKYTYNG